MPAYKSYCWSLGTTSFRMVEFNRKIEEQLKLLNEFWQMPAYSGASWSSNNALQTQYYNFIKQKGFIEDKDAPRKDKDAREKTSGLVDIGLITDERRLTPAGQALLFIAEDGKFDKNNILQIPSDSFVYFKQLLKTSIPFEDSVVRPYIILAYLLSEFGELSKDEFAYLLPLATDKAKTKQVIENIQNIRAGKESINDAILSVILNMPNYQEAKAMFLSAPVVDEQLMMEIGMNRKSREYDIAYLNLYNALLLFKSNQDTMSALKLFEAICKLSKNPSLYWKFYLFNTVSKRRVQNNGVRSVRTNRRLFEIKDDVAFREEFFNLLHLFKAKSLLDDYFDLNRRYFKTTDTVLFQDNKVKLDIIPSCYFSIIKDDLLDIAFAPSNQLFQDCSLSEINKIFDVTQTQLFSKAEELYGVQVRNLFDIQNYVDQERYQRFNKMIDERFSDDMLISLLTKFEKRADDEIRSDVTNNADIPTIFEYILAIIWYKVSGRQGKVLEYMNLSLDADLLPITHAAGGHEDITYHYEATEFYPAHTLLIEATLANSTNQRRMEMEPVSRHLGDYLLSHNEEAYCLFATTFLHVNVIADFRSRKVVPYYSNDGERYVDGMKIIPCNTAEIKTILLKGISYNELYTLFNTAFSTFQTPNKWYQNEIVNAINNMK